MRWPTRAQHELLEAHAERCADHLRSEGVLVPADVRQTPAAARSRCRLPRGHAERTPRTHRRHRPGQPARWSQVRTADRWGNSTSAATRGHRPCPKLTYLASRSMRCATRPSAPDQAGLPSAANAQKPRATPACVRRLTFTDTGCPSADRRWLTDSSACFVVKVQHLQRPTGERRMPKP